MGTDFIVHLRLAAAVPNESGRLALLQVPCLISMALT